MRHLKLKNNMAIHDKIYYWDHPTLHDRIDRWLTKNKDWFIVIYLVIMIVCIFGWAKQEGWL
jgi:predicted negative regulator of RcsB-dependent stress response